MLKLVKMEKLISLHILPHWENVQLCAEIFSLKKSNLKTFNKSMLNYLHNVDISLQGNKIMF